MMRCSTSSEEIILSHVFDIGYGINIDYSGNTVPTQEQINQGQSKKLKTLKVVALVVN